MPGPFQHAMLQLVTTVFGPLGQDQGIAAALLDRAEARLAIKLPTVLREFYVLTGRDPRVMEGMNHLLGPEALYIKNGALVFEEESQHYFFSGIPLSDLVADTDDPPVMQGNGGEDRWYLDSRHLSDYLLVLACWQACNALPASAQATISGEQLARIQLELNWANHGVDAGDDTVGLWGFDAAITAFTKSGDAFLGARSDGMLRNFAQRFGLDLSTT